MALRMWTLDLAREQSPKLEHLYEYAAFSLEAGYDTLGFYLEHRFAYPSAPWAQGTGCLTPNMVQNLRLEFPSLKIVPFVNLLGHMEGFLNCEHGTRYRETPFRGMQGCPTNQEFVKFCVSILEDTLLAFDSELVHIGGDETWELCRCEKCKPDVATKLEDRKAEIYHGHFLPLIEKVVKKGRRPGIWGDMFLEHPKALEGVPKETQIFDWQYFGGLTDSAPRLAAHGHEVVGCPTIHVYDAAWMHTVQSDANVRNVSADCQGMGLAGVCLTTWECGLFGAYDTVLPAVGWARKVMDDPALEENLLQSYGADEECARLIGKELNALGGVFGYDGHRHRLKSRLLLYGNPFLAWKHHAVELSSETGLKALEICERAIQSTQNEGLKGSAMFIRAAVEFVRIAEAAHIWYAQDEPDKAIKALAPARHAFETLETIARRTRDRIGGSLADIERCKIAKKHVETVIHRIGQYGRRELGYLPSFDTLTHSRFVPHDQACWWGVNKWGDE